MAKQIKIGFDKTPAPVTKQFQQLVDIEGTKLFDDAGNPLYTEESAALTSLTLSDNALSVFVNNENTTIGGGPIPVEEQFKEVSEVSSSLLGVPRAEEQLSLFSDVATYGLDIENWDASDFDQGHNDDPPEWYRKEHPIHGRRSNVSFYEGSDEQALYLKAFPTQYSFPYGTNYKKLTSPENRFIKYMNFIALGRYLHDYWTSLGESAFANENFLSGTLIQIVTRTDNLLDPIPVDTFNRSSRYGFNKSADTTELVFRNSGDFFDVDYIGSEQDAYDAIERFTAWYDKIKLETDVYPKIGSAFNDILEAEGTEDSVVRNIAQNGYKAFREYELIKTMVINEDAIPGNSPTVSYHGILQSKRTFRYQPGRVSGFTFGVRMASDNALVSSTVAEWGCSNDTDEYMFQLKGDAFSIIRRSTKKLSPNWFEREGVPESAQTLVPMVGVRNDRSAGQLWETKIIRERFNGDALNGGGESGYNLKYEDVTMYKIEFSWYGAIGAKFYAYVPVGTGDARWILMHTFVIENALGVPVLENPDFRMKYLLHTNNTKNIRSPIYLYKYGSSVYVDGGDEGTIRLNSETVDSKPFTERTPILGIMPKEVIKNSQGVPRVNFKKIYPSTLTVTSDRDCRIDFEEIKGSPNGVHFSYAPSLKMNGRHPKTRILTMKYNSGASRIEPLLISDTANRIKFFNQAGDRIQNGDKFSVTFTTGSNVLTINSSASHSPVFTGLQVGDTLTSPDLNENQALKIKHFIDGNGAVTYDSTGTTILHLENNLATDDTASPITMDLLTGFNTEEIKAHIIADGVYGTYIDTGGDILKRGRITLSETAYELVSSTGTNSRKKDKTILNASLSGTVFDGALSTNRAIVSSKVPITASNFKIHFLNPVSRDPGVVTGETHNNHWSEFSVGITPYEPFETGQRPDSDPELKFLNNGVYEEYDPEEFPRVDFSHANTAFDQINLLDLYEQDSYYGNKMQVDPRLDRNEDRVEGINKGLISTVSGSVETVDLNYLRSSKNTSINQQSAIRLEFPLGFVPPEEGTVVPGVTQVGINFLGTDAKFITDFVRPLDLQPTVTPPEDVSFYVFIERTNSVISTLTTLEQEANSIGGGTLPAIQMKTVTLKDDWMAYAVDEVGEEKYLHKKFTLSKGVSWDTQPLYPVFALGDHSRINGIVIEEILEQGIIKTHTPDFVTETHNNHPITIVTTETVGSETFSSSESTPPSAFNSNSELSASRYDKSNLNQLRPGTVLYSTFVGQNETVSIDLSNIFARDRKGITRGSLNNRAVYMTATSLDLGVGSLQLSVTNKEQ
jgi:hypothetical protein